MSTCNRLDLETLGSQPLMPKILTLNQYKMPSKPSENSTIRNMGLSLSYCPNLSEKSKGLVTVLLSYESSSKPQKP